MSTRLAHAPRGRRGFTLIEMMVTLVVLGVLLAVAAPSFREFSRAQRIKAASFELYSTLLFARSEAIKRRTTIDVAAAGTDWANGWTVQVGATVLRSQDALPGVKISGGGGALAFAYGLDGRVNGGAASVLVESVADGASSDKRCISVDTTGMPRSRKTDSTNC